MSDSGTITGKGVRKATVTARTYDGGLTASCEVTVELPVSTIQLEKDAVELSVGQSIKVNVVTEPADADEFAGLVALGWHDEDIAWYGL